MGLLQNISVKKFTTFLGKNGFECLKKKGHSTWKKDKIIYSLNTHRKGNLVSTEAIKQFHNFLDKDKIDLKSLCQSINNKEKIKNEY